MHSRSPPLTDDAAYHRTLSPDNIPLTQAGTHQGVLGGFAARSLIFYYTSGLRKACRLHFTASWRQKHRRWVGIGIYGQGTTVSLAFWDGFSFASHFSSCITRCLFYYFYLPMLDTDGRNGRLIFFNSISLFCDTFRHGSVTAKAGLRVEPAIRQKSD